MCTYLGLLIVGHVMIGPDTHLVEVMADGEVAEYIVSGDVFTERSQCAPEF